MAPERITGQSYTITSDVWSLGVTLLEVAQHRFPFPADGTEMQPKAGLIDLLTYIVRQPIPKLKDEEENGIKWSKTFKYFIECWYVFPFFPHSSWLSLWCVCMIAQPPSFFVRGRLNFHTNTRTAAWRRSRQGGLRRGGCWSIPGWWRCTARKSTWSISCGRSGIGRIE